MGSVNIFLKAYPKIGMMYIGHRKCHSDSFKEETAKRNVQLDYSLEEYNI